VFFECAGEPGKEKEMCATPTQSRLTTEITERSQFIVSKVFLPPLARLLMSSLFVWDGIVQLRNPGGTAQYFASVHVPAPDIAVWISILVHLLGGLALLAGFYSRWAAALLALVCLGTALGVHLPAGDPNNMIHFYKNLVMTGGFLYVIAFGPGVFSLDREAVPAPAESHLASPAALFRRGGSP